MMPNGTPTADGMMNDTTASPEGMMESPTWYGATFTDARTGQTFSINDFKGQVVLVETMTTVCDNCNLQQEQIKTLHKLLGNNGDLVSLSIDIDTNESADALNTYMIKSGFDWYYAIASSDITNEIASLYGDQFLDPASTPILIIDRHGEAHPLPFGIKNADDLMKAVQPYLSGGM